MNETEARTFRAAYDGAVKRLSKMSRAVLVVEERAWLADQGIERLYQSGPPSKDELVRSVLDLRGYTVAKLNESTHVIAHEIPGQNWPDCPYCQAVVQMLEASDRPVLPAPAPVTVPTGTGWPVGK